MSNNKKNAEQNRLIDQTEAQRNAFLAKPEDFEVQKPNAPASMTTPGHGQQGDSKGEQEKLLAERKPQGKGVPLPAEVDDAKKPHTK